MGKLEIRNDRTVLSTENNGYAGSERDENLIEEDLVDTEIPVDDRIPDGIDEIVEDDRPRRGGLPARSGRVPPPCRG